MFWNQGMEEEKSEEMRETPRDVSALVDFRTAAQKMKANGGKEIGNKSPGICCALENCS